MKLGESKLHCLICRDTHIVTRRGTGGRAVDGGGGGQRDGQDAGGERNGKVQWPGEERDEGQGEGEGLWGCEGRGAGWGEGGERDGENGGGGQDGEVCGDSRR